MGETNFNTHSKYTRKHKRLSNGQHACLHVRRTKYRFSNRPSDNYIAYSIGFVITDSRRQANDWYSLKRKVHRKLDRKQTGRAGLEGLKFAFNEIRALQSKIKPNEYIVVSWDDDKRKCSYKYLERLGFSFGDWDGKPCYYYLKENNNDQAN